MSRPSPNTGRGLLICRPLNFCWLMHQHKATAWRTVKSSFSDFFHCLCRLLCSGSNSCNGAAGRQSLDCESVSRIISVWGMLADWFDKAVACPTFWEMTAKVHNKTVRRVHLGCMLSVSALRSAHLRLPLHRMAHLTPHGAICKPCSKLPA